jgi:hypothetical protein
LESSLQCPYAIDSSVWDAFGDALDMRQEHPGKALVGAMIAEMEMS